MSTGTCGLHPWVWIFTCWLSRARGTLLMKSLSWSRTQNKVSHFLGALLPYLIFLIYHSHLKTIEFTVWAYCRSLRPTAQMDGDVKCEEWALRSATSTSVLANLQDPAASWPPQVHHSMALPTPMWLNHIWCLLIVELLLFLTNNSTCPRKYRWRWRVILGYLIL